MQTTEPLLHAAPARPDREARRLAPAALDALLLRELGHRGDRGRAEARAPRDAAAPSSSPPELLPRPHARRARGDRAGRSTASRTALLRDRLLRPLRRSRRGAAPRSTRTPPPSSSSRCRARAASTCRAARLSRGPARALPREVGALLVLDEIQTGIGRTGPASRSSTRRVVPDVMTLGKGLGGGFPIAAFLCTEDVAKTVSPRRPRRHLRRQPARLRGRERGAARDRGGRLVARAAELGARVLRAPAALRRGASRGCGGARGRGLLLGPGAARRASAPHALARAPSSAACCQRHRRPVLRFFPALNIPEEDLWPALETVLGLIAAA